MLGYLRSFFVVLHTLMASFVCWQHCCTLVLYYFLYIKG